MTKLPLDLYYYFKTGYNFLFRPKTYGSLCLIFHKEKVLLIGQNYGRSDLWNLPGGGRKADESPESTVIREVWEEVGIKISSPIHLGQYFTTQEYKQDTVDYYFTKVTSEKFHIDRFEIARAQWFPLTQLPPNLSHFVRAGVGLFSQAKKKQNLLK